MRLRLFLLLLLAAGCGGTSIGDDAPDLGGGDLASAVDLASQDDLASSAADLASGADLATNPDLAPPLESVTFTYTPDWAGVTSVTVIGGFGTSTDWKPATPFLRLTKSGTSYTGTAMLASGSYPYLFLVTGDAAATPTLTRYALDPFDPDFIKCPAGSPTAGVAPNPCSVMTVPQKPAASIFHLKGKVVYNGAAQAGYLAVVERFEPASHHFFANRVDTDASGDYDMLVAAGTYRIQVWHPTYLNTSDAMRVPGTYNALLRAISSTVSVAADVTLAPSVEVAFTDYAAMAPQATTTEASLPTTFTVALDTSHGYTSVRAEVFGGAAGFTRIGDPWWASASGTATSLSFNGTFNTTAAKVAWVVAGTRYFWGEVETSTKPSTGAGAVSWTGESMVFPITWN